MASTRNYQSVEISIGQGGGLMADRPVAGVDLANYTIKENWRREGFGRNAEEVKREGWDYFVADPEGDEEDQYTIATGVDILAVGDARRPNGKTVAVACGSNGKVYFFDYDNAEWAEIGTGYSTPPVGYCWQIVNVGSYCVFNNGIDLPFTWLVGDANVTPIYEMREAGIASVGSIWESNQILCCADILEILPGSMSTIMNGGTPYGQVTNPAQTQRIQFRKIWSNNGDPRDFAATVNGSVNSGSASVTLAWPMASLTNGTEIIILGAGTDGGNLTTTISSGGGTGTLTVANTASTTVSNQSVSRASAIDSIVGFYEFDNDGSAVLRGLKLQNRTVVYKATSIFVGYYTGDFDEPWSYDCVYTGKRTPRYRWTLTDIGGGYHLYAGDEHFYRFKLGTQEPLVDEVLANCENTMFFDLVGDPNQTGGEATESEVRAADNACTNEVFFMFRYGDAYQILAYDYVHEVCDSITLNEEESFICGATIHKPMANETASQRELIFVMGDTEGLVTQYGKTNLAVTTYQRYGANFTSTWQSGYGDFGDPFSEKDVRSWVIENSVPDSSNTTVFKLYGADRNNQVGTLLETKTITATATPSLVPLYYRRNYFMERIECSANEGVRISARIWEVARVKDRGLTRIAASS